MGWLKIQPQMVAIATMLHEVSPTIRPARRSQLWVPVSRRCQVLVMGMTGIS
jgi:hypothetical protein